MCPLRRCEPVAALMKLSRRFRLCHMRVIYDANKEFRQVAIAPPGTQAASADIAKAYRTVPVLPAHKPYIVVAFEALCYLDHTVPFGLTSAGGLQGHIADAIVDILLALLTLLFIIKWVNDFVFLRFPVSSAKQNDGTISYKYAVDWSAIKSITDFLGVPWKDSKGTPFGFLVIYVGFAWHLLEKKVSLPETKRTKYEAKISTFLATYSTSPAPLRDILSIQGTLSHITFVIPAGRSHLTSISHCVSLYTSTHQRRYLSHSAITDLRWWLSALHAEDISRSLVSRGPAKDYSLWVDASSEWGIGVLINGRWAAWRLANGWKHDGRDIGWAETVALELALLCLEAMDVCDSDVIVRSDNQGSIGAYLKGRGRNFHSNLSIRRMGNVGAARNIQFLPVYVKSADNLADPVSRGILGHPNRRVLHHISLPEELSPYLVYV